MWTYILRRLLAMIPALIGVTIVSFCVMQLAPGDPMLMQLGPGGMTGQSSQTREAYLIQRRDLKLDKPLLLNFYFFLDFAPRLRVAAHYMAATEEEVAAELSALAPQSEDPEIAARLKFLRSLDILEFQSRFEDPVQHARLAKAVQAYVQRFCEDTGSYGVAAAMEILRRPDSDSETRIGIVRCLNHMVVEPFLYTYSRDPSEEETPLVASTWKLWWEEAEATFPELDPDRRKVLEERFAALAAETSRMKVFEELEKFERSDMRLFVEKLLGDSTLAQKSVAAAALRLYIGRTLKLDLPRDADERAIESAMKNWKVHYEPRRSAYEPNLPRKAWAVAADTQYAHMVWRLVTFNFGRSALRTREPVAQKLWTAVIVSAPLMIMAQLVIYFVAVPLGILCAVTHGSWTDRLISLMLFLLYSIPPFVAAMMFLLFFCYGDYLKLFPMLGLHSDAADQFGFGRYLVDYLWHAFLPVICLSLFSLAGMAMYSRTSMLDVVGQDYIRTARAKGLPESTVILKHGFRNAMIPIITLFSNFLPAMLGGSVLIEVIFGIPGMGRLGWESIEQKDFPTLMALLYVNAIVVMISILMTDILYMFVDPRISFEAQGKTA